MAAVIEIPGYDGFERVGAGASGVVFRARQLAFGDRLVAIKVIPDSDTDDTTARRFRRECMSAGRISWHPNVVSVYDAGITDDGLAFLVMEYLEAGSLGDRLRDEGALPWHRAVDLSVRVAGALAAAHEAGLIHRDLKPENILMGPFGEPELGDFGIAFIEGRSRSRTGTVSGTIAHSAPEALAGNTSESTDIYALGSTLYTLVAGAPAFVDANDHSITPMIHRIATGDIPDLRPRGVPAGVAAVIEKAMAKEPEARWPSARAFGEALQEVQRSEGQAVTPLLVSPDSRAGEAETRSDPDSRLHADPVTAPTPAAAAGPSPTDAIADSTDPHETVNFAPGHEETVAVPGRPASGPSTSDGGDDGDENDGPGAPPPEAAETFTAASPNARVRPATVGLVAAALGVVVLVVIVAVSTRSGPSGPSLTAEVVDGGSESRRIAIEATEFPANTNVRVSHCGLTGDSRRVDCTEIAVVEIDGDGDLFITPFDDSACLAGPGIEDIILVESTDAADEDFQFRTLFECDP